MWGGGVTGRGGRGGVEKRAGVGGGGRVSFVMHTVS